MSGEVLANGQNGIALEGGGEAGSCKGQGMGKQGRSRDESRSCCPGRNLGGKNQNIYDGLITVLDEMSNPGIFSKIHFPH